MGERWVNAELTFTVPLDDVAVDASPHDKVEAAANAMDRFLNALPDELGQFVGSATWEDVEDGEPLSGTGKATGERPDTVRGLQEQAARLDEIAMSARLNREMPAVAQIVSEVASSLRDLSGLPDTEGGEQSSLSEAND